MSKTNEFTDAVLLLKEQLSEMRKTKPVGVPFMHERVAKRQTARNRFQNMSSFERQQYIDQHGTEAMIKAMQGGDSDGHMA